MARVNFILPSFPTKPGGGVKIMFEFANRLVAKGHKVTILYSVSRPFKRSKTPVWLRLLIFKMRGPVRWFKLDKNIHQKLVPEIADKYVPDADATLCTWWQMAYAVNGLSASKGNKCNLIQGYEIWTGQEEAVHQSYKLPLRHAVIASYLQKIVERHAGTKPPMVPLAIDDTVFKLTTPANERDPATVIMLYSLEPVKGSEYGIEALTALKKIVPGLRVTLFSVFDRPETIPSWMEFHTRPANLPELYNKNAVFISPSLGEGWALPPAEAMACGCTVVCTNIGGHADYSFDGKTALLTEAKNPDDMVEKVLRVISQPDLRLKLSAAGNQLINTEFNWATSVSRLESVLFA